MTGLDMKHLRQQSKLSQVEMAEALGVPYHTYTKWERKSQLEKQLPQRAELLMERFQRNVLTAAG